MYAITTDIEKAFLHVNLDQADQDATLFYWLSNTDDPESEFIVYRFKSVLFGATSSPFILNATLNKHLTQSTDQVSMDILRNLYVDYLASGTSDGDSAVNYYQDARDKMSLVGFNLRSWSSNGPGVQRLAAKDHVLDTSPTKRCLACFGTYLQTRYNSHLNKQPLPLRCQPRERSCKKQQRSLIPSAYFIQSPLQLRF